MQLNGYIRADGRVGFRNLALIVPLTGCLAQIAWRIADQVPGTSPLIHANGCDFQGQDGDLLAQMMANFATHPNVGAVLFLTMGCAAMQGRHLMQQVEDSGRLVAEENLHRCGGTSKSIAQGIALVRPMVEALAQQQRQPVPMSSLVLGTKCGSSNLDSFNYCHAVIGAACDKLVDMGATVVLSEDCELYAGAEELAERAANAETAKAIRDLAATLHGYWIDRFNIDLDEPETDREKNRKRSLEHAAKAGSRPFQRVFDMSEKVSGPGLVILNGPNTDLESMTTLSASGCQLIAFTTGQGTVVGSPVASTVKMTATYSTAERMAENIDLDVSGYKDGSLSLEEAADKTLAHIVAAANGEMQKAEILGHGEIAFPLRGVTF
jgi:altronate dehydratase large subunit